MQHCSSSLRLIVAGFIGGLLIGTAGTAIGTSLGSDIFDDVSEGVFYDAAVGELYGDGVIKGYDSRHFGPDDYVTRGQLAVMLQRFQDNLEPSSPSSSSSRSSSSTSSSSTSSMSSSSTSSSSRSRQSSSFIASKGIVRFTTASYTADEDAGSVTLTLIRYGGNSGEVEVSYTITGQSASVGSDFNGTTGKVSFEDEQTSRTINITLLDDSENETDETLTVYIDSVTNRAGIGSPDTATVTIRDNETSSASNASFSSQNSTASNAAGTLSFATIGYTVNESAGTLAVTVNRDGGSSGTVGITFATTNGTGTSGTEYSTTIGTLSFGGGETTKTITIPIYDDDSIDGNKNFTLKLSSPTGGASLGSSTATITVFDNEGSSFGSGSIKLSKSTYTVLESAGYIDVIVQRVGGAKGTVTVDYTTISGTAYSGADFTAITGTLTFAQYEASKAIRIPLVKDSESETGDYFRFHLTNPSSTSNLIDPYQAVINIEN